MGGSTLLLSLALAFAVVQGFDTGHHADACDNAMRERGYNDASITVVSVQNFFTDLYSQSPLSVILGVDTKSASTLHFDSLPNLERIQAYWDNFVHNTKETIDNKLMSDDISDDERPLFYLSTIGITLHALQDFYTHSHWALIHQRDSCGCFRYETWFTSTENLEDLFTGMYDGAETCDDDPEIYRRHGAYCQGENKDSYIRPNWREAYVFSYAATLEWINAIETWVGELEGGDELIAAAKSYEYDAPEEDGDGNDLESDAARSLEISEWVIADLGIALSADGHWKGWFSGDQSAYNSILPGFLQSDSVFKDVFVESNYHKNFAVDLYCHDSPEVEVEVPAVNFGADRRAVLVRIPAYTTTVDNMDDDAPDTYAIVTINGQEFREAAIQDRESFTPMWTAIHMVDAAETPSVEIQVRFWEQDVISSDDELNVNGDEEVITLQYDLTTNSVSGDTNTLSSFWEGSGDRHVEFTLVLEQADLGGCTPDAINKPVECEPEILARSAFCHVGEETVSLCLREGSETECSGSNRADVEAAIVQDTSMNPLDLEITCDADNSDNDCDLAEGADSDDADAYRGRLFTVLIQAPTNRDAEYNADLLLGAIETNDDNLGPFTVLSARKGSGAQLAASLVVVLVALVVALFA